MGLILGSSNSFRIGLQKLLVRQPDRHQFAARMSHADCNQLAVILKRPAN